jgi:hypothetical protein
MGAVGGDRTHPARTVASAIPVRRQPLAYALPLDIEGSLKWRDAMDIDKEPAEGSRETVDDAIKADKGARQGVTNKPAAEEERQQEKLPPRGTAKRDE